MSFREVLTALRAILVLWVITALLYPFVMIIFGIFVPYQASGSLIKNAQGEIVGSALIGQTFTSDRYFWSRPSVVSYSEGEEVKQTGVSGASNLAPSNPDLMTRVKETIAKFEQQNLQPTADLVYTSGSGLDPHITREGAAVQVERIAQARSLTPEQIKTLITENTEAPFLGIFGEPGVNVLKLNLALDQL